MGSTSDLPVMEPALNFLEQQEIPFEVNALSAHRTPHQVLAFAEAAAERGIKVIIAAAGGAAHLPGVIAAATTLPVVGVPVKASISMDGWDSMLSMIQMPDFKGNLSDLGGPSANMYGMGGRNKKACEKCTRPSCINPQICPNLNTDHSASDIAPSDAWQCVH